MDAGFISVVEIGQYFMTKDTGMMDHHNQKDGFRETRKLDPYWKLRTVACMVNTELKSEFGL